ncbi:MAG: biotin/lipoate A/B protein ligase family protein [Candidatus Nanosalina sp.]
MAEASVKIPEGKLVKVKIEDGEVTVHGDFFLEPPEALEDIQEKLSELGDATREQVEETLRDLDAEFIGFSPEHIAEAFTKAREEAEAEETSETVEDGEDKLTWRVINEGEYSEAMHHAIDEVLTEKMENGEIQPTLRFWYRRNPSVPFGRFQSLDDEVEVKYAEENNIEVVRRITGGGAMFAEPGNVITYSLYIPKDQVPDDIRKSYRELDRFAVEALQELGVDADYEPLNDVMHEDGKLGGAAQLRKDDAVLHHTTMSFDLDTAEMLRVLRIGKEKVSDKAIKSAEQRVSRISDHVEHDREEVIEKMIEKFSEDHDIERGGLSEEELEEAKELAEKKFSSEEWNNRL